MSQATPQNCFMAQTVPVILGNGTVNPDIGGLIVKLAAIINNVLLSILLRWSDESYLEAVYGHYSQIFPILLSTVASIPHQKLSLFEGNLALVITASPISIYLTCRSIHRTYKYPRSVLQFADRTGEVFACWLGLIFPFLWWSLNLVVSFSTTSFSNSHLCEGMTFGMWIYYVFTSSFVGILDVMGARDLYVDFISRGGLGTVSLVTLWIWSIYFIRHLNDILELYRERRDMKNTRRPPFPIRWVVGSLEFAITSWDVIASTHSWLVTVTICCFHWHWLLAVLKGTSIRNYDISYGQILSAFSVFPAFVGMAKFLTTLYRSRIAGKTSVPKIQTTFCSVWTGLTFFLIGNAKFSCYRSAQLAASSPRRSKFSSFLDLHEPRIRFTYILIPLISLATSAIHAGYITTYVNSGTLPNLKNFMNTNHSAWKPLSVILYLSGYLIGCFNSFVWAFYFDLRRQIIQALRRRTSRHYERLFSLVNVGLIIPLAILMCLAPLFSPYAALSLTQKHQWRYRCKSFPGEAILDGSSSSFTIRRTNSQERQAFSYRLQGSKDKWSMTVDSPSAALNLNILPSQLPVQVLYDTSAGSISAQCSTDLCLQGNYTSQSKLSLQFQMNQTTTFLETEESQWNYPNDAPSFIMRWLFPGGSKLAMETAVTEPNGCQKLKVCLATYPMDLDVFASLGVVLLAQNAYAAFCAPPKLYNPDFDIPTPRYTSCTNTR